jgi:UDP-N-acetylglucosamine 2-epimerase
MKKVAVIFGTRPEAIKLAPVILELKKDAGAYNKMMSGKTPYGDGKAAKRIVNIINSSIAGFSLLSS